jgi:hypothetical protein
MYDNYIIIIFGKPRKNVSWLLEGGCDSLFEKHWYMSLWNIILKKKKFIT